MPIFAESGAGETVQNGLLVPYCGPVIACRYKDPRRQMVFARRISIQLAALLKENFGLVRFAFAPAYQDVQPFIEAGYFPELRFTYRAHTPIHRAQLSKGRRSDLDRFARHSATIAPDQDFAIFDVAAACDWNGDPGYTAKTQNLLRDACARGKARAYVAQAAGQHLGGLVAMTDGATAFSTQSYYTDTGAKLGASTALYVHAINTHLAKPDAKCFDFEGSVLAGVERFYQSFGAEQTPYVGLHWAADPARLNLHRLYEFS
jgi:hypothetical protein